MLTKHPVPSVGLAAIAGLGALLASHAICAAAPAAQASTSLPPAAVANMLRLCTLDAPFAPYTLPDGKGLMQKLVRQAAQDVGWRVINIVAPRARCLGYLQEGAVDALIASFLPERMAIGVFPMASADAPDLKRALGVPRFAFYRLVGTPVAWDGSTLTGLEGRPVGVQFGFIQGAQLKAKGIPVDDSAKASQTNFDKLLFRRLSAVLATESEGQALLANPRYAGRVEAVAAPYVMSPLYLQVSKQFDALHHDTVEALWAAVRRRNEAAASGK